MAEQLISIGNVEESDALGSTLHQAVIQGNKKALKRVLDKGIHVDYPNDEGQSPLFCACFYNHEGVVDYLLSAGANPNEKSNSGLTPVIVAGFTGNVKILIKLLNESGDLRLHDNHGRNVKDWAMLQPTPKKRMKMLEFLDKARLFAMSSSGQDLLMKKAPSNILHKAHHRQNTITKMITNRIGRHSVHNKFEKMATSQHSLGFGQVYANGSEETGFLSSVPLVSESNLRHDPHGETYNNGAFAVMESMWWDYTEVTIKRLHRDIDPFQGGVVDLLINEIEHIGKLRHPHVLTLMGVCQTNNLEGLVLIYERIGQGSLYNSLHQKNERLPSETIQAIAVQMCNAITFIHLRGLVHCAITSHAISVVNANTFKLGNFEYMVESSKCELGKKNSVATNTNENCVYNWLAPEVIFNLPPSFYCDMYSYCVVLWELFHGDIPWDSQSSEAIRAQYSKGNFLKVYGKVAEYFKVIMEYGLELDPNKRKLSFLHVRDLLLAAPKDAQYYLKTHFQHLNQADNKTENSSSAKFGHMVKPSAPQAETKTEIKRLPEYSNTSRTVDQGLRDKHERRRQKEKERAKRLDDSDNEQAYGAERQKMRAKTETRQVTGQNVDDHNNNCSEPQNDWNIIHENLDRSPRKAAKPTLFKTEGLDWEIFPKEAGEEFLYTVQVTRQPSPAKQPSTPLKSSPVKTSPIKRRPEYAEMKTSPVKRRHEYAETSGRQPCTSPRKRVIEVTSSEETETSATETTESSSEPKLFARGRELGKVTSSMGRFSYLTLDNHQQSRSSAAKPACHATHAVLRDEYSTLGKLTTAGSVFALYNDHSPDLPMGQPSHREPPDYATLRRRLLEMKEPSAPPSIQPEKTWFAGRGSVRDLAQLFQQQIQEHDFYQAILDGRLSNDKDGGDTTPAKTGPGKFSDYGNHAKCRLPPGVDKADKESFGSLSTVTMSDGELTGEPEGKSSTTFTSTSLTDSRDMHLSTSTESYLVGQWVDHEIRKIKRHLSKPAVYDDNQMEEAVKQDGRNKKKSPDVFGTYQEPSTACSADVEDSSSDHFPSMSGKGQPQNAENQHLETGDHLKEPETFEDFYFDDELYAKRGKKSTRIYYDSETSAPSVISESPQTSSLPMDTVLKSNSMSSVEDRVGNSTEKQSGNRKKLSRIPTSRSKLVPKTKGPEEVYSNIVTVRSSLDGSGLHQVTHKMKNLQTGGTKTLVNDTVSAQKVTTKIRAAN